MVDVVCVEQPQASWEERSMKHYAGLDVIAAVAASAGMVIWSFNRPLKGILQG
jgi:hypothetical protein